MTLSKSYHNGYLRKVVYSSLQDSAVKTIRYQETAILSHFRLSLINYKTLKIQKKTNYDATHEEEKRCILIKIHLA